MLTAKRITQRVKFGIARFVKRSPTLWPIFWELGTRHGFLLPHDKSYYGFAHFATPKGTFLDIGANNGITALGIHKVLPDYSIISIEADPRHQPALERAKRRLPKFEYRMIGASDTETELALYTPRISGQLIHALTSSDLSYLKVSVARDFGDEKARAVTYDRRAVKCVPLDQLELSPDIVKIDIEGYELPALRGLTATIDRHRPIIMVEFTPNFFDRTKRFLDEKGVDYFTFDENRGVFSRFDYENALQSWKQDALQVNVFSVPQEKVTMIKDKIASY